MKPNFLIFHRNLTLSHMTLGYSYGCISCCLYWKNTNYCVYSNRCKYQITTVILHIYPLFHYCAFLSVLLHLCFVLSSSFLLPFLSSFSFCPVCSALNLLLLSPKALAVGVWQVRGHRSGGAADIVAVSFSISNFSPARHGRIFTLWLHLSNCDPLILLT